MHTLRLLVAALLLLCLALPVPAAAQDSNGPRTCVLGMPVSGHDLLVVVEVLQAVFEPAGYRLVHKELPYKRALEDLNTGKIQCTLTVQGVDRTGHLARTPIAVFHPTIAYLAASGFPGIESMVGEKVAYLHGYDMQQFLPAGIVPQVTYDLRSATQMLNRGHARYLVDDEYLIRKAILDADLPMNTFGFFRLATLKVVPLFAPTEDGRRMQEMYDQRMRELADSGELQALLRKYGMDEVRISELIDSLP